MTQPLYSIRTWDPELQKYTPQIDVPCDNLTRAQLVASMRMLQDVGYSCHRIRERDDDGNHTGYADSDPSVMIERIN